MSVPRTVTRLNAAAVTAAPARLTPAGQRHEHVCDGKSQYRGEQLHVDVTAVIPPRRKRPVIRIVTSADPPEASKVRKPKCTRSKR